MQCERCDSGIDKGEEREHLGQTLCEDCYMDALSPVRSCDPWAVHSAKSFEKFSSGSTLTNIQSEIIEILKETEGIEPHDLIERFNGRLTRPQLEREMAALRHMEKMRAEMRDGKKVLIPW